MSQQNLNTALAYYASINNQDLEQIKKYYHPDIKLLSPLAEVTGKNAALEAAKGFMMAIKKVTIRAQFESQNQVMLANDIEFPAPIGILHTAVLITFKDDLIACIEMFYDTKGVEQKKEEIFGR